MSKINFGTDGWRGIIAEDFTFDNVKVVAQAIADYVTASNLKERGVIIGYDNRFLSDKFAEAVACVLAGNGIKALITEKACPTPVTAYAIIVNKAAGAVMITASHNPPEYNGIKFIPEYAGPALPEITNEIEGNVKKILESKEIREIKTEEAKSSGLWQEINPFDDYIKHAKKLVDLGKICTVGLKVIVDPMGGAGIGYLDALLQDACSSIEVIHNYRDPLFFGKMPEPSAKVLTELREMVLKEKAHLGLAMDGDADRFGIIDSNGKYITPNQVLTLLFHHLLKYRGMRGPVARTVATTHMLDKIAEEEGLEVFETPVGFKYIGEALMNKGCILGGEESGGLSIKGHIPEKDGILAAALITEVLAVNGKNLTEILWDLEKKYGSIINDRIDIRCSQETKERVLGCLKELKPAEIAGKKVIKTLTIDGKKCILEDGSWVLVRASGTEPLFRIYAESSDRKTLEEVQKDMINLLGLSWPR